MARSCLEGLGATERSPAEMWRLLPQEEPEGLRSRTGESAQAADRELFEDLVNIVCELDKGR
jgi:hypothetical protein